MKPKVAVAIISGLLCAAALFTGPAKACLVSDAAQPADELCTIERYLPKQQTAPLQEWTLKVMGQMRDKLISEAGLCNTAATWCKGMTVTSVDAGANVSERKFAKTKSSRQSLGLCRKASCGLTEDISMIIRMAYDKNVIPQNLWLNIHSQSI